MLKADTAVNSAIKIPLFPYWGKKATESKIVPKASQMKVEINTNLIISFVLVLLSTPKDSLTKSLFLKDSVPLVIDIKLTKSIAYPNPPIWNRLISTIWPNSVRVEHISIGDNPVTHTAEVAINKASIGEIALVVEKGSIRRNVPKRIIQKNPKANRKDDGRFLSFWCMCEIPMKAIIAFF